MPSLYHGPPELTLTRALTEWTLDPWGLALILLLGGGYLYAMRRARAVCEWPVSRPFWFLGLGLGPLVLATMSWIGAYDSTLFYARATQTVLLVLVVPLFLALGRPVTLFIQAFPGPGRRVDAVIGSRLATVLTFPAITTFALVIVPFVLYFSPWYTAGFRGTAVRELTFLALMTAGHAWFWTLLRVDPVPKAYPYAISMWITAAEVVGDAVLGVAVIADNGLIGAAWYHAVARPWGPSLRTDQVIGGGVLWILGDLVGLPFLAVQLIAMMREDESEAASIDAELDTAEAAATAAALTPAGTGTPDTVSAPEDTAAPLTSRPWWEADRRFTGRFTAAGDESTR
jgi:cytochrome c oxidase assembly factor CtaG